MAESTLKMKVSAAEQPPLYRQKVPLLAKDARNGAPTEKWGTQVGSGLSED
jgi:hypothetical protein